MWVKNRKISESKKIKKSSKARSRREIVKGYGEEKREQRRRRRRRRVSHIVVQTSVEKRPRSQFGCGAKDEAWKGRPVNRGCITFSAGRLLLLFRKSQQSSTASFAQWLFAIISFSSSSSFSSYSQAFFRRTSRSFRADSAGIVFLARRRARPLRKYDTHRH